LSNYLRSFVFLSSIYGGTREIAKLRDCVISIENT